MKAQIFRVKKDKDYSIMPNKHLRNPNLSLRAKGLLTQILSLPPEWNYTLRGLSYINREGLEAITTIIHELERAGYITRERTRNEKGQITGMEYTVYSSPELKEKNGKTPIVDNPTQGFPMQGFPTQENPTQ